MKPLKVFVVLCLFMLAAKANAQSLFATLTGIVSDSSGALIPGARVTLRDEKSGSLRTTVTDNAGFFTFVSVSVGDFTYELTIETKGFDVEKLPGIVLLGGETRNVNVAMKVGNTSETVTITGSVSEIVPVDSGEKSVTLTEKELQNFVQVGSNAAEYIKIAPGFGISNGTSNKQGYTGQTIGINANGDSGSQSPLNGNFSSSGLPAGTLDIISDGAHVSDPGCNCDTPVNPNADFISEFKINLFNFNAEDQKGPQVISTVTKSGGSEFHGSGFFSARNYVLNSNDALFNASGQGRPQDKYYYPGGTIGGPVLIPGTPFNHNHNKLFFFTGFEYFYQVLDTGLLRATVPTSSELGGNFSPSSLAGEGAITATGAAPSPLNAAALTKFPGGIIPSSLLDPNMLALAKLYPAANADPNSNGGYNYVQAENFNQNNWQSTSRVDYDISDNTKLFVRYNLQKEVQLFPVGLWWRQTDQVPYPSPVQGRNQSQAITASLTHVFSPTMTNEFVFAYTYVGFPNVFADPSKVDRSTVGYNYTGIYNNGVKQIPSFGGYGWNNSEVPLIFQPGGFEAGGNSQGLYADKWLPSASDTVAKVWGKHTLKIGFFCEWIRNSQPGNDDTNGYLEFYNGNSTSYGNAIADLVTGNLSGGYVESSFNRINDISYSTWEGFVQDSWKASKKLTLNYGLRITDFTPWTDRTGAGYAIFNPAQFNPSCASSYCGFEWHKIDSSIPTSGFPSSPVFFQPRFGLAYDVFGSGKTVIRGGWGRFYFHSGQFTSGLDVTAGVQTVNLSNGNNGTPLLASQLSSLNLAATASSPTAVNSTDNRQPYTDSYSFTIAQRLPWSSLVEVAYVGNSSHDLANTATGAGTNANLVPVGALYANNGGADPNGLVANNFRPYLGYGDLPLATNDLYANYNALQASFIRTKGRYTITSNYTFGKALGIVSNGYDQYNLRNDYGVQSGNRTHIFNLAYSVELPKFVRNKFAGGIVNGWQVSGIVQVQSGANLTANASGNFGLTLNGATIPGLLSSAGKPIEISNSSLLGTPDIQLNPILTCNPTANLARNQYINPNCFSVPSQIGQNGPTVLPAIYGPGFFNADLGVFKNFAIKERMKLQFRIDAFNFLNHPLYSFNGTNLTLGFTESSSGTFSVNTPNFGTVTEKQGNRIIQLAVKFYF